MQLQMRILQSEYPTWLCKAEFLSLLYATLLTVLEENKK